MNNVNFEVQTIYDLLSDYDSERVRSRQRPRGERASSTALKIAGGLGMVFLISFLFLRYFQTNAFMFWLALISGVGAQLAAITSVLIQVVVALPKMKKVQRFLKYPMKALLPPSARIAQCDYDFSENLASYDEASLQFIATRMHTHAEGMRSRVGLVIGSIERVGVVPLMITVAFAIWRLLPKISSGEAPITFWMLLVSLVSLACLYVVGIEQIEASRRIDELAGIVKFAVESRSSSNSINTGVKTVTVA